MAVFLAMLKPGDTVLSMSLDHGGHLSHGSPVNFSGMYFHIVPYGVNDEAVRSGGGEAPLFFMRKKFYMDLTYALFLILQTLLTIRYVTGNKSQ